MTNWVDVVVDSTLLRQCAERADKWTPGYIIGSDHYRLVKDVIRTIKFEPNDRTAKAKFDVRIKLPDYINSTGREKVSNLINEIRKEGTSHEAVENMVVNVDLLVQMVNSNDYTQIRHVVTTPDRIQCARCLQVGESGFIVAAYRDRLNYPLRGVKKVIFTTIHTTLNFDQAVRLCRVYELQRPSVFFHETQMHGHFHLHDLTDCDQESVYFVSVWSAVKACFRPPIHKKSILGLPLPLNRKACLESKLNARCVDICCYLLNSMLCQTPRLKAMFEAGPTSDLVPSGIREIGTFDYLYWYETIRSVGDSVRDIFIEHLSETEMSAISHIWRKTGKIPLLRRWEIVYINRQRHFVEDSVIII